MFHIKKCTALFIGSLMLFNLMSCRPEEADVQESEISEETQGQDTPLSTPEETLPGSDFEETIFQNTPEHISKTYGDNFTVDAEIHVPKVNKADILLAEKMTYDEQKAVSVLFDGKNPQRETDVESDSVSYSDGNAVLTFSPGILYYCTQDWAYYKFPTDDFRTDYEIYSLGPKWGDTYKEENLSFMTREEALESVSSVLRELSIDITGDVEIYAVDSATMQAQQERKIKEMSDYMEKIGITPTKDKTKNDPTFGYQTKEKFTPEDDFYRFYFKVQQNEIPITQKVYTVQANERDMEGSLVEVALSKNGIIEMHCSSVYQQQGVWETSNTFLSVEEAIQKAMDIHNQVILADKITVLAIDFEYVPVPYNDNYQQVKLVPTWSLTLQGEQTMSAKDKKSEAKTDSYTKMMFINAITGERIQ